MKKERVISILIHGASKAGKSTVTSTAPLPLLVIDAEGSWKFIREQGFRSGIPLRKKTWDPLEPPPRHDGTWDVAYVSIDSWESIQRVVGWLSSGQHDFVSIVLDSITELQRRLKTNISGDGVVKGYDGWGAVLARMDQLIRGIRDLTINAYQPVCCVIFIAETVERNGKWRPYMQGQIATSLPYWVDLCGYLYQSREADENGNMTRKVVNLFIGSHDQFESGERVQGLLPDNIINPNVSGMLDTIYPEEVKA
jgi:hypothetical protein